MLTIPIFCWIYTGFYESAFVFVDALLLEDMISDSHPKFNKTGYQRCWLRDVGAGEKDCVLLSADDCRDSSGDKPRVDIVIQCDSSDLQKSPGNQAIYEGVENSQNGNSLASFDNAGSSLVTIVGDGNGDTDSDANVLGSNQIISVGTIIAAVIMSFSRFLLV